MREGRVVTIDAEMMNRPGPRLGEAARALRDALHPGAAPR
jgi:ABC-type hemin transport system substrate-binding protein